MLAAFLNQTVFAANKKSYAKNSIRAFGRVAMPCVFGTELFATHPNLDALCLARKKKNHAILFGGNGCVDHAVAPAGVRSVFPKGTLLGHQLYSPACLRLAPDIDLLAASAPATKNMPFAKRLSRFDP